MLPNEDKQNKAPFADPAKPKVIKFFDAISAHYANAYSSGSSPSSHFFRRRRDIISRLLQQNSRGVLLDAGCGPGVYAQLCVRHGFLYHGLDSSPEMIAECRRQDVTSEKVSFQVGAIESLPFEDKSFDVVLALGVLEYLDTTLVPVALGEFRRVLKVDGVLIMSVLNRSSVYWLWTDWPYRLLRFCYVNAKAYLKRSERIKFSQCSGEGLATHKFLIPNIKRYLRALRFELVEQTFFASSIVPQPLDTWLPYSIVNAENRLEPLVNVPGLHWLAKAFIISGRRKGEEVRT